MIQIREKTISSRDFLKKAQELKTLTEKYHLPLIVNDRLDIALAADTDGLHLGQDDLPLHLARKYFGSEKIIGVSASNIDEAKEAEAGGADYIGVGAMFPTNTKKDAHHVSMGKLAEIKAAVRIPVVAIGGINASNTREVMDTGIDGVSVVSAILGRPDIRKAAEEFIKIMTKNK